MEKEIKVKKGFTLVELMVTLSVIAAISLIVTPLTIKIMRDSKQKLYETQLTNIKSAARAYMVNEELQEGETKTITLEELSLAGKLEKDIKNPKNGELLVDCIIVQVKRENDIYVYDVIDKCE